MEVPAVRRQRLGILTTASDLLFTGGREGYVFALDARDGKLLWRANLGGQIVMAPVTYMVGGKQYISVISGHTLVTFALGTEPALQIADLIADRLPNPAINLQSAICDSAIFVHSTTTAVPLTLTISMLP